MIIDCGTCVVRGDACGDCVVSVVLGPPEWLVEEGLTGPEATALAVLADSGLVPPLRLVAPENTAGAERAPGHRGASPSPRWGGPTASAG